MKKLNQIMLLMLTVSVVSFTSCSSDDDGGGGGSAPSGVLVAKVNGANFQSLDISSSAIISNNPNGQTLGIVATSTEGNAFSFTVFGYAGLGTYNFDATLTTGVNVASYSETTVDLSNPMNSTTEMWQAPYENLSVGSITISEETDSKIMGTFEFTCKNLNGDQSIKTISDGSFNLEKQTF